MRDAPGLVADALLAKGRLIAAGGTAPLGDPDGRPAAWLSTDARTWERAEVEGTGRITALAGPDEAGDGLLVAVGERPRGVATQAAAWSSVDGLAWTAAADPAAFEPAPGCTGSKLEDVARGASGFVAVGTEWGEGTCGQHPAAWWSGDGLSWTRVDDADGHAMHVVVVTEDGYVAAGAGKADANEGARAAFWFSPDGQSWERAAEIDGFRSAEAFALAVDTHGVAAVGYAMDGARGAITPAAWRSADGRAWTRLAASGFDWTPEPAAPDDGAGAAPATPTSFTSLVLADGLIATDAGLIATGPATATSATPGADGSTTLLPWHYALWTAASDDAWVRLPDADALEVGTSNAFVGGPAASLIFDGRLLLFGSALADAAADQPPMATPRIWEASAEALGLGPGVETNAWWKDPGGGVVINAAPDAGGALSWANCPTLEEARAAVPEINGGPDADAVPFKTMVLQCSYTVGGLDLSGHPAGLGILVFDAAGVEDWASVRTDPGRTRLTEIPGLGDTAFATGEPGHEDVWVVTDAWALHMSTSRIGGIPLDQMVELARTALVALGRPPR